MLVVDGRCYARLAGGDGRFFVVRDDDDDYYDGCSRDGRIRRLEE